MFFNSWIGFVLDFFYRNVDMDNGNSRFWSRRREFLVAGYCPSGWLDTWEYVIKVYNWLYFSFSLFDGWIFSIWNWDSNSWIFCLNCFLLSMIIEQIRPNGNYNILLLQCHCGSNQEWVRGQMYATLSLLVMVVSDPPLVANIMQLCHKSKPKNCKSLLPST